MTRSIALRHSRTPPGMISGCRVPSAGRNDFEPQGASVECWIGVITEVDRRVVRVAGRLGVAHVPELLSACDGTGPLELNLTDLASADNAGIEALQRVRRKGAILVGTPGYIQLKIDSLKARQD